MKGTIRGIPKTITGFMVVIIMLISCMLNSVPTTVVAEDESYKESFYAQQYNIGDELQLVADSWNVRSSPEIGDNICLVISQYTVFEIKEVLDNNWYKIYIPKSNKTDLYIQIIEENKMYFDIFYQYDSSLYTTFQKGDILSNVGDGIDMYSTNPFDVRNVDLIYEHQSGDGNIIVTKALLYGWHQVMTEKYDGLLYMNVENSHEIARLGNVFDSNVTPPAIVEPPVTTENVIMPSTTAVVSNNITTTTTAITASTTNQDKTTTEPTIGYSILREGDEVEFTAQSWCIYDNQHKIITYLNHGDNFIVDRVIGEDEYLITITTEQGIRFVGYIEIVPQDVISYFKMIRSNGDSKFQLGEKYTFTGLSWFIRNGMSLYDDDNIIGVLCKNDSFRIIGIESNGWYKVITQNNLMGWIRITDSSLFN